MAVEVSLEQVERALQRLPVRRRKEALLFIEFLEYLGESDQDDSEDAGLWAAVLAHQAHRASQDEIPDRFDSPQAFLQATTNLQVTHLA